MTKGGLLCKLPRHLLLSDDAIRERIREYTESQKLKPLNGGSSEKLSTKQSEELEKHLHTHTYLYVKDIISYVKAVFDVDYTIPGMHCWIKRHGFSYKKPSSSKLHVQEDVTLNAASTIAFLKKIESAYPTKYKIHVICDNARYYRNKDVTAYLEDSKVELHFLPPYSPNLNPIERIWKWMKERVMYNTYYADFMDFRNAVLGFLQCVSDLDPDSLLGKQFSSRIRDNFRALDTPATAI